jgi:lipoate-protein ligase A
VQGWRLIDSGPMDAFLNMAVDEALAIGVREGMAPTLRFYSWERPSVSIGCFQKAEELDLAYLNNAGIPFVRRPTGGRALLHGLELTYSFSAGTGEGAFSGGLLESYRKLSSALSLALRALGLDTEARLHRQHPRAPRSPLCFQSTSYGEITVEGRKVVGSAQKRWQTAMLQQGSMPFTIDIPRLRMAFRTGLRGKVLEGSMAGLREFLPGLGPEALKAAIRASFEEVFGTRLLEAPLTDKEEALAGELLQKKYRSPEWNLRK